MNVLRQIRRLNLSLGIILILAVNSIGALPRLYKPLSFPVGPEIASVYSPQGEEDELLTPIETRGMSETGFIDTGQHVQVHIVNWYKDDMITFYPRWTLLIGLCMVVIHLTLVVCIQRPKPSPN